MQKIILSILICTLVERRQYLERILKILEYQRTDEVEILVANDNRNITTGEKRNRLMRKAKGEYVVFVDDDDIVSDNYVCLILEAIKRSYPDCIGIEGIVTIGATQRLFVHSIQYASWFEKDRVYFRCPNHISPVKRTLALKSKFPNVTKGEDRIYSEKLYKYLKTEEFIPEPIYYYIPAGNKSKEIKKMRPNILFKYATRGRPEWFKQTLEKYYNMMSKKRTFQFIITMDTDDLTMNNPEMKKYLDSKVNLKYYYGKHISKVHAINDNLRGEDFDILVVVSDDMEPVMRNYDDIIVETMQNHFPDFDGALHFNDACCGRDKLITFSILGKTLYDTFGYVYNPIYKSEWCDTEFTDVVYGMKKVVYCPIVIVKHNWGGFGVKKDEVYKYNSQFVSEDKNNYLKRKSTGFKTL